MLDVIFEDKAVSIADPTIVCQDEIPKQVCYGRPVDNDMVDFKLTNGDVWRNTADRESMQGPTSLECELVLCTKDLIHLVLLAFLNVDVWIKIFKHYLIIETSLAGTLHENG